MNLAKTAHAAVLAVALLAASPAEGHPGHYRAKVQQRQHDYDAARAHFRYAEAERALRGKRYWQARQRAHARRSRPAACRSLSRHQRRVLHSALRVARRLDARYIVRKALVEAGLVESRLRNLAYGHADSVGFLQQRPSMGWPRPRNVRVAARSFVVRAKRIAGRFRLAGRLAQAVQRSAYPSRYHARARRAARLLRCH